MDLGVDTSTIMGAAMAQVVSVFSELERKRIGERTKEALAVKKAEGVQLGRPASISPQLAKRIVRMPKQGMTLQAICDVLNDEGVPTARGGRMWRPTSLRTVLAA
jgi:DNA invertase Pin-like site-specific DNA recombinase